MFYRNLLYILLLVYPCSESSLKTGTLLKIKERRTSTNLDVTTEQQAKIKTVLAVTLLIVRFYDSRQLGLTQYSKATLRI